ncbi:cobalamin-dependent protein [bacterium]|nr:cobalamin-dependent protein [bacterium]
MDIIRLVTATALFDGHDVSINIFRKLMQKKGAEVIHLGHNRSVSEIIKTALEENADAILISSYQGGHNEFFRFLVDSLKENGAENILVFGGGGGVIMPDEIKKLEDYGVSRLYHANDGQNMGIDGIADDIINRICSAKENYSKPEKENLEKCLGINNCNTKKYCIAKQMTFFEDNVNDDKVLTSLRKHHKNNKDSKSLVIGITGTGGSGKSSLIDELINRFIEICPEVKIAVLAVDPTKRKSGGALLGDRIRYNNIFNDRVFFRSFATRHSSSEISLAVTDSVNILKNCGYDMIFVETSGIGQGDSKVVDISDLSIYVMTSEFGAPSQLDKIDMLEIADFIVINKYEKSGSEDALREVTMNYVRDNKIKISHRDSILDIELPLFATSSNQFNNPGVNRLFKALLKSLNEKTDSKIVYRDNLLEILPTKRESDFGLIPNKRINYLDEIVNIMEKYKNDAEKQAQLALKCQSLKESMKMFEDHSILESELEKKYNASWDDLSKFTRSCIENWNENKKNYKKDSINYTIQNKEFKIDLNYKSLAGSKIPKIAFPPYKSWYEIIKFCHTENLPGYFPFTAGVFPFKRTTEDPKRQFAGEGSPAQTNRRFHYLCEGEKAKRLSVAFDGISLYAENPHENPDIYGKIGESGVSICTIDDMDVLFNGFDLVDPYTSVSMTINAPAPIMLAMYFMVAAKREEKKVIESGKTLTSDEKKELMINTFRNLRGTVQADILKEDQGQNTCIFSVDFAMKLLGDVQEYLSKTKINKYYSLSISGYHIAEAGANAITQLALTLSNAFTYVEYFLSRGIDINSFAPNLSFFFSNGMEPEYSVIGRVARRIWAVALKERYNCKTKGQKLKYHIQTSGRSLHAREIDFNDIRTTLQALIAYYDNCNSLHTNSYDEAITTPTEESVRRSMAIQLIIAKEYGLAKNENPNQGSFIISELTDLVEEAVMKEFGRISRRGGVLGAMEKQYQRSIIQEESLLYEELKHSGEYPVIGINTFLNENEKDYFKDMEITRCAPKDKDIRLKELEEFIEMHKDDCGAALEKLRETVLKNENIFEELLNTVQHASLGQITKILYETGGKYRRGM